MQPSLTASQRRSRSKKSLNSNYFNQLRASPLPILSSSPNKKAHQYTTDNRSEQHLHQNRHTSPPLHDDEVNEQPLNYYQTHRTSQHSRRTGTLTILEDSEAYPRRSSQITHEPYWYAEKAQGVHPFQTPTFGKTEVHKFWEGHELEDDTPNLKNSTSERIDINGNSTKKYEQKHDKKRIELHKRKRSQSLNAREKSLSPKISINMNNHSTSISSANDTMYIPEEDVLNLDDVQQAKFHNSGHYVLQYGNSSSDGMDIVPSVRIDDGTVIVDNEYSDDHVDMLTTPVILSTSPKQVSFVMKESTSLVEESSSEIGPKLTLGSSFSQSLLPMCTTSEVPDSIGAQLTPCKISTDPEFQFPGDGRKHIERFGKQISILKQARHSVISIAFLNDTEHQSLAVKNNTLNNTSMNIIPDDELLTADRPAKLLRANSFSPTTNKRTKNGRNSKNSRNSRDNSPHKKMIKGLFGFVSNNNSNGKSPMSFKRNNFKRKYKKRHTTSVALTKNRAKTPKASMLSSNKRNKQNLRNYNRVLSNTASTMNVRNGIQSDITKIRNEHLVKENRVQRASSDINCLKNSSNFTGIYPTGMGANMRKSPLPSLSTIVPALNNTNLQTRDIIHLIPMTVSNYIKDHELDPNKLPVRQDFETVAMFADVSGFTKLSEHLANSGPGGAEKLAFYLNRYLEQIAAKVRKEGGDVFKFAGDAIIIIWLPDEDYSYFNAKKREQSRCESIARAVQAARAIQKEFHNAEIIKGFVKLSIKIGIGYGETSLLFVGGQFGRVEYLISGTSVAQAFRCESYATAGDVIISREAYEHVAEDYVYGSGMYYNPNKKHKKHKHVILLDDQLQNPHLSKKRSSNSGALLHVVHEQKNSVPEVYKVNLSRKKYQKVRPKQLKTVGQRYLTQDRLRGFVPRAAWQRLSLRHKPWHGEQRAVTVLFINLDFGPANDLEHMDNRTIQLLQIAIKTTQQCIYRYKGSLNKFLFDDKGSNVVAVFGLPPIANFDDCTRGVLSALLIEQEISRIKINPLQSDVKAKSAKNSFSSHSSTSVTSKSGVSPGNSTIDRSLYTIQPCKMVRARIGVNTGRVYCGLVGAAGSASEYGILGDQVNLAARLMQHACKDIDDGGLGGSGVVVSNTTYEQAKECINIHWESLKSATVKGFSKEFRIWRPSYFQLRGEIPMKRNRFFIAWSEYMEILSQRLLELVKSDEPSSGHVIALEADHKGGSTHFARELLHTLQSHVYVVGTVNLPFNDQHDEHSPLFAWRALLSRIVRECRLFRANEAKFHSSFARFLIDTGGSHLVKYLPVLNQLLDCKFAPEDPLVAEIVPDPFLGTHHARLVSYAPGLMEDQDVNSTNVSNAHIQHMKSRKTPTAHTPSNSHDLVNSTPSSLLPPLSQIDSENEYISNKLLTEEEKQQLLLQWRVELIVHLLQQVCKYTPMVLIISKFQYMAVSDWEITDLIADKIFNHKLLDVSLVLSGWSMNTKALSYLISPQEKEIVKQYHKLRDKYVGIHFVLPKWTKQEVRDFLKHEFDINHTTKHVLQFIMNKTDGIPGVIKSLVHDQKLLFLKHGGHLDCSKIERCGDLNLGFKLSDINLPIPYSIQSYFTKMLDSLEMFCLLTIKTAAVISVGQEYLSVSFAYDMIERVHPLRNENGFTLQLHHALNSLIKEKFICVLNTSHYGTSTRNDETTFFDNDTNIHNYDESSNMTRTNMTLFGDVEGDIQHNIYTFYHFTSGYLRDVTYGNMLYKQRSVLHKRLKEQLDEELQTRDDKIFRECRNRHHILSLNDGFVHDKELIAQQKQQIIGNNKEERHGDLWWSFPHCVLILFIQAVTGVPDALEPFVYVSVHVGDDKGKHITSSMNCRNQYLTITLDEHILQQIEDEYIGPVLTIRLWHKQNYRADQTIGKFTLRLRELYEKQLSEQMIAAQQRADIAMGISLQLRSEHSYGTENISDSGYDSQRGSFTNDNKLNGFGSNSKRNSLNSSTAPYANEYQDLFVGYKMTIHVKQKKIARFNIEEKLYLETFVRFCSVENDPGNTSNYV